MVERGATIIGSCKWCHRPVFADGGVCECCDICGQDMIKHEYSHFARGRVCPEPDEPKYSLEVFIALKTEELLKFQDDWRKDLDTRYPDEMPKDPWTATKAKWEERYSDRANL